MIDNDNLRFFLSVDGRGGPITSTPATDMFPDVRGVQAEQGVIDYACVYFVNTDPNEDGLIDPELWIDQREGVGGVGLAIDPAGKNADAQTIETRFDPPMGVRFNFHPEVNERVQLPFGPYRQNDRIAIWIRRQLPQGAEPGVGGFRLRVRGDSY